MTSKITFSTYNKKLGSCVVWQHQQSLSLLSLWVVYSYSAWLNWLLTNCTGACILNKFTIIFWLEYLWPCAKYQIRVFFLRMNSTHVFLYYEMSVWYWNGNLTSLGVTLGVSFVGCGMTKSFSSRVGVFAVFSSDSGGLAHVSTLTAHISSTFSSLLQNLT